MTDPVPLPPIATPVQQVLPFEVQVERWFQSKEIWSYIAGQVLVVCPTALDMLANLNLPPMQLLIWTIVIHLAVSNAGIYLKNQSVAVVGDKSDKAMAIEAPPAEPLVPA